MSFGHVCMYHSKDPFRAVVLRGCRMAFNKSEGCQYHVMRAQMFSKVPM